MTLFWGEVRMSVGVFQMNVVLGGSQNECRGTSDECCFGGKSE